MPSLGPGGGILGLGIDVRFPFRQRLAVRRSDEDVGRRPSEVTVDYVEAGSRLDITLFFGNDPRQGDLAVRPLGYVEP